jgi:hypothetical protein
MTHFPLQVTKMDIFLCNLSVTDVTNKLKIALFI